MTKYGLENNHLVCGLSGFFGGWGVVWLFVLFFFVCLLLFLPGSFCCWEMKKNNRRIWNVSVFLLSNSFGEDWMREDATIMLNSKDTWQISTMFSSSVFYSYNHEWALAIEMIHVIQGSTIQQHILCFLPSIDTECRKFLDGDTELLMMGPSSTSSTGRLERWLSD